MKEGWQEGREGQSQGKETGSWPILTDAYLEEDEQTRPPSRQDVGFCPHRDM